MQTEIDVAIEAGIRGATEVERYFGKSLVELSVEYKPRDGDTPRTIIDRESGAAILYCLQNAFPSDTFDEEETGVTEGSSERKWHIDPFDGTSNALINMELSTVGIALQTGSRVVVGVAVDPFGHKVYAAELGGGAFEIPYTTENGEIRLGQSRRIRVSQRGVPKERYAEIDGYFNPQNFARKSGFLGDLSNYAHNIRMTGSNIRSGLNLASGGTDIWLIDAVGGFYDIAPGAVLIPEAGGTITNIYGNPLWEDMQVALASNNVGDHEMLCKVAQKHYEGYAGFR